MDKKIENNIGNIRNNNDLIGVDRDLVRTVNGTYDLINKWGIPKNGWWMYIY